MRRLLRKIILPLFATALISCSGGGLLVDDAADKWIKCYRFSGQGSADAGAMIGGANAIGEIDSYGLVAFGDVPDKAWAQMATDCPVNESE